ncbi:gametogenetin isoform X2 [Hyalella azteca]|uniref:Gametogenetin isoform X2 n=1 Tax=Hyalella azteca TaxID=294128 RepID=A0A8B7P145_HYAAZ|nr:gametogenetin isoform X2 [Hyalella azteca]
MAESMEALLNLHDSDSVDDEEDNEARVDVVEVPPTITVATQGSACDAASVAASDLPVNQEKIAENITGSAEEKGNTEGQEVEVERCDPSGASSESRVETRHVSSVSEVSIQDAGPSCGNESEGKIESSIEQAKNVNAQPKEMSKPEEAANGSLANSKDVSGNASEDNNSMPKKMPDATQKKRSSDSQGPSQDTAHNHGPFGFNFQHQWHPFMAAGPQPPLFNPPPPHPHPPPFYGPVFTSGQTAPVFFPPSMPYHSAPDLRRSFPGPNNSPDMPNSQPIPMPYPPLFPMPPLSFPFMPTPPPPPPLPQADSAPTEEDGLPPPLVPNPTESSLHAALLSTIGAAAQMASSAKIVSDQISGAFSGNATGAGDAHAQQSASNSSSEEQGNAGPNSQEQTAGNEQRQNNPSSSNGQWQFQHGPNKNGGYGCSFSNGPEGMRGHFSAHHNVHRAGACHSHRRHAPNAPGNPGRPPFCGRFHDRFRPQGWPFERDFLRPGFRQNVRLGRMSAGRTHMFDENLDEDFFRDVPRNAAAENSDSNNEDDGEEIPTGGNATKTETFSGFTGNTNGTSTTTTTDATSGTTEHVHVNINLSSATAASESAGATRAETEHESVHSFGATANATPGTPASAPTAEEIYDGHLYCPLCPYTLDARSGALFDEHIDSHLEYICPVCSTAFQRSKQAEYEAHVNDHFSEEEAATAAGNAQNSSGPWGNFSWSRMDFD